MEVEKGLNLYYKQKSFKPNLFIEYMDAARFKGQKQIDIFKTYLLEKYAEYAIDSVILDGPPAAGLLVAYPELFEHSEKYVLSPGALKEKFSSDISTTIPVNTDYETAVKALLKISQGKTVYLVAGTTTHSKERVLLVSSLISTLDSDKKIVRFDGLSMDTLLAKVSTLNPSKSIIFFLLFFRDADGVRYTPYEALEQISNQAAAPVYSAWTSLLGSGIVGGYLLSGEMLGQTIGTIMSNSDGVKIMNSKLWMEKSHGFFYDWRQLKRWNIPEKSLPVGSKIFYKKPTFYEQYYKKIITGSLILVLVISFFWNLILRKENRARLIAEEKLKNQNEQLEILAVTDRLTGLFNRIKLDQSLQNEIKRFERYGHILSVIIMDIDYFKKINDTYGHQTGDEVLRKVSATLTANLRQVDIVGRWGGEEFLIICPETSLQYTIKIAEKLRDKINYSSFDQNIKVTASFGVSEIAENESDSDIIQKADAALYKAKENGRNRVEHA